MKLKNDIFRAIIVVFAFESLLYGMVKMSPLASSTAAAQGAKIAQYLPGYALKSANIPKIPQITLNQEQIKMLAYDIAQDLEQPNVKSWKSLKAPQGFKAPTGGMLKPTQSNLMYSIPKSSKTFEQSYGNIEIAQIIKAGIKKPLSILCMLFVLTSGLIYHMDIDMRDQEKINQLVLELEVVSSLLQQIHIATELEEFKTIAEKNEKNDEYYISKLILWIDKLKTLLQIFKSLLDDLFEASLEMEFSLDNLPAIMFDEKSLRIQKDLSQIELTSDKLFTYLINALDTTTNFIIGGRKKTKAFIEQMNQQKVHIKRDIEEYIKAVKSNKRIDEENIQRNIDNYKKLIENSSKMPKQVLDSFIQELDMECKKNYQFDPISIDYDFGPFGLFTGKMGYIDAKKNISKMDIDQLLLGTPAFLAYSGISPELYNQLILPEEKYTYYVN